MCLPTGYSFVNLVMIFPRKHMRKTDMSYAYGVSGSRSHLNCKQMRGEQLEHVLFVSE